MKYSKVKIVVIEEIKKNPLLYVKCGVDVLTKEKTGKV